jgi:hypothetical protein
MGIEPTWSAWEAGALPLSYTRETIVPYLTQLRLNCQTIFRLCSAPLYSANSDKMATVNLQPSSRVRGAQVPEHFLLDALECVINGFDVASQKLRDFLVAFPIQESAEHLAFQP